MCRQRRFLFGTGILAQMVCSCVVLIYKIEHMATQVYRSSLTCINPGIDYSTSIQYNHFNNSKPNVVPQIVINIVIKMKLCLCPLIISTGKESDETKGNLKWRRHGLGQWHDFRNKEFARGLGKYFLLDQYLTADKNVQYGSHILLHHNKGIQQWDTKELHMCAFFLESS